MPFVPQTVSRSSSSTSASPAETAISGSRIDALPSSGSVPISRRSSGRRKARASRSPSIPTRSSRALETSEVEAHGIREAAAALTVALAVAAPAAAAVGPGADQPGIPAGFSAVEETRGVEGATSPEGIPAGFSAVEDTRGVEGSPAEGIPAGFSAVEDTRGVEGSPAEGIPAGFSAVEDTRGVEGGTAPEGIPAGLRQGRGHPSTGWRSARDGARRRRVGLFPGPGHRAGDRRGDHAGNRGRGVRRARPRQGAAGLGADSLLAMERPASAGLSMSTSLLSA